MLKVQREQRQQQQQPGQAACFTPHDCPVPSQEKEEEVVDLYSGKFEFTKNRKRRQIAITHVLFAALSKMIFFVVA